MSRLPAHPSLEYLRKLAKSRRREQRISLSRAQFDLAREYGFDSWPKLVHGVQAGALRGVERALVLADVAALARFGPAAAVAPVDGLPPLLVLLRRSIGTAPAVRQVAELLLDAGADPSSGTAEDGGWRRTAVFDAVERHDLALVRLLLDRGAVKDEDAFYHACEQWDTTLLDLLYEPGYERLVNHKLDFEDAAGLRWFLDRGADVNASGCLHWAIGRGRGPAILAVLLAAGADVNLVEDGRKPLAVAARCGHLAAYELLASHGATAELDEVDRAVLALAKGESVRLPQATAPVLGVRNPGDYSWILGQFALLGRVDVVRSLLDGGMAPDTRGWSNFTPLDQAAMHGRTETVRLLIEYGADVNDHAFDDEGPSPLDCALWGLRNNRAEDGDYVGTVRALLAAGATTGHDLPIGDPDIDALFTV